MPSPAEQPEGSRPWWREPLPPEEPEREIVVPAAVPAPSAASGQVPAAGHPARPTQPARSGQAGHDEHLGRDEALGHDEHLGDAGPQDGAGNGAGEPQAVPPPPWEIDLDDAAAAGTVAGPDDATVVMEPVRDATQVLPPVPPDPSGFPPPAARTAPVSAGAPPQARTDPPAGPRPGSHPGPLAGPRCDPRPGSLAGLRADPEAVGGAAQAVDVPAAEGSRAAVGPGRIGSLLQRFGSASGTPRDRRSALVGVGGAALALVLVIAGAGLLVSRLHNQAPTQNGSRTGTAIDLTTVRGSASSVQRPDGGITYTVGNTLDGDPATAWNSDGTHDGRGPGITLSYRFTTPVDLSAITLRNGYQKVRPNGVDLWERNERVKQLEVVTDTGQWTWDLQDVRDPQTLERKFGRTRIVKLKILQVYPSTKYSDVAISEIAFTGIPAA